MCSISRTSLLYIAVIYHLVSASSLISLVLKNNGGKTYWINFPDVLKTITNILLNYRRFLITYRVIFNFKSFIDYFFSCFDIRFHAWLYNLIHLSFSQVSWLISYLYPIISEMQQQMDNVNSLYEQTSIIRQDSVIQLYYSDVIMGSMTSLITSVSIVNSTVNSGADQTKHQSSASLAFVWGIHRWSVNSPHKEPVTRKMFPFVDVIMICWAPSTKRC